MESSPPREEETVENRSSEVETSAAPGVGLVIGSELVNPDPVSNTLLNLNCAVILLYPHVLCTDYFSEQISRYCSFVCMSKSFICKTIEQIAMTFVIEGPHEKFYSFHRLGHFLF
jgi:hypothetical protein